MKKVILYPYSMKSSSAKLLSSSLSATRVYPDRNYQPKANHLIVNWGNSTYPNWRYNPFNMLNDPLRVSLATNKLKAFNIFKDRGVSAPDITENKTVASWWIDQGYKVFCRTLLTGHSGKGIVIASSIEELVEAPLYVKAVKKDKEYRVHVFNGRVIDYQQKKKRVGFEGGVSGIRNHSNGWVYARSEVVLPESVEQESIKAVAALGLDFGAVDICTSVDGDVYVFEVNTAPGLTGTTLEIYKEAISELQNR